MADEKTNARIVLSRHTLAKYEQMPVDFVHPAQSAQLVADEITVLRKIMREHPEKAITLGDLIGRWTAFAESLGWKLLN